MREILADLAGRQIIFAVPAQGYIHRDTAAEAGQKILELVGDFHRQSPESPGLPLEQLRQAMPIDKAVLDGLVARLKSEGRLVEKNGRLALPEHRSTFRRRGCQAAGDDRSALPRQVVFARPTPRRSRSQTGVAADKVAKAARPAARARAAGPGGRRACSSTARPSTAPAKSWPTHFRKEGRLESVQFKYLLDTTRKFALPLLDYMDRIGVTRRVGNTRYPKNPPSAAK